MTSFFARLTGSRVDDEQEQEESATIVRNAPKTVMEEIEEENEEGQLAVDVYQTARDIIVQAVTPGLTPDDLEISLTHEMITIKGKREIRRQVSTDDFFYQELYWGTFGRSILLPQEVDPDEAEATIKNGILTIKLPKLNKEQIQKLKVKNE